jgi:hypothetical protein
MTLPADPYAIFTACIGEAQAMAARCQQRCKPSPSRWQTCSNLNFHPGPGQAEAGWASLALGGDLRPSKKWSQRAGHGMAKEAAA